MHDYLTEIEEHPPPLALTFATDGLDAGTLAHRVFNLVGDRANLSVAPTRSHDEVRRDDQGLGDIQDDDVLGLLLRRR